MKTYAMADESVTDLVAEILSKHYPEHLALRFKVDVLMVSTDEEARAICEALRAQMRAEVETNEDHIIIRLMENWTLLLWRVFPPPTIG